MMWWFYLLLAAAQTLAAEPVGLVNGSFEADEDGNGVPDGWSVSGNESVTQSLAREQLPDGSWCAVLRCTAFERTSPASHAMLAQVNTLRLERGQWYRFRMRLRGENVPGGSISIAISNTREWSNCGLDDDAFVAPEWRDFETIFQATQTISENVRLQLWWTSTGTVWFDEISLEPIDPPRRRFNERIAPSEARNRVPNGGFECGPAGWGSVTDVSGWGGNLNRLVGAVVGQQPHSGASCLAIPVDRRDPLKVWFDYYELLEQPVLMPLAANRGWIPVEPGETYTLSAWVRAEPAGVPVVLRIQPSAGRPTSATASAGGDWTPLSHTFQAASDQLYVAIGPDLREGPIEQATLYLDDVMIAAGATAETFEPRAPLEIGVRLAADGGLFEPGRPFELEVGLANHTGEPRPVSWRLTLTDFDDREAARLDGRWEAPAGASRQRIGVPDLPRGFYRVRFEADGAEVTPPLPLRAAVIPFNRRDDTVCGMNHGYPTGDLLDLSRRIGLGWFRDWSYKWQQVEPTPGAFDFSGPDAQVDRVREHGLRVLGLLPFPSAHWSSSGPPPAANAGYQATREHVAYAPKNDADLANYVRRTAEHLRGRIDTFEIFNEPIYTTYALPQRFGYKVEDYVRLLAICAAAVREGQPEATVIGGIQAGPDTLTRELIAAGGLEHIDALSLHTYPGRAAPEYLIAGFETLRARMAEAGHGSLPLYWTEGAYYADDDEPYQPYQSWLRQLPDERLCAIFTIRLNAILCGHDTRRIIYHSGTPGRINNEDLAGVFFEYDGLPRKVVAAVATFNELIAPDFVTRGRVPAPAGLFAYRFESDGRAVVIVWSPGAGRELPLDPATWQAFDLQGNRLTNRPLTVADSPVYLVADRVDAPLTLLD